MDRIKRHKSFLGSIIGAIGNIFSADSTASAMREANIKQTALANMSNAEKLAANLSSVYGSRNNQNAMEEKVQQMKCGGKKQRKFFGGSEILGGIGSAFNVLGNSIAGGITNEANINNATSQANRSMLSEVTSLGNSLSLNEENRKNAEQERNRLKNTSIVNTNVTNERDKGNVIVGKYGAKINSLDRIRLQQQFACGGRKRY